MGISQSRGLSLDILSLEGFDSPKDPALPFRGGEGNALAVPVFNIGARVILTVSFH